jgi:hypothetical protein
MKYNLSSTIDQQRATLRLETLIKRGAKIELKELRNSRSEKQNKALHLFFTFISDELNEIGLQYQYTGISGKTFELRYTSTLVKEFVWRPIQIAMFNKKSTTQLDTKEMNDIIDVILVFFGDRGISLEFPSIDSLMKTM